MRGDFFRRLALGVGLAISVRGQAIPDAIATQLRELANQMAQLREELADSRRESADLRRQLTEIKQQLAGTAATAAAPAPTVSQLAEEQELLAAKVDDQFQTKVESGSKYRVKFSGIALINLASTRGAVDSVDLPSAAEARGPGESSGTFSASVRQSILGLDVDGPTLAGARTHGEVRADFFGGLPHTAEGSSSGLLRLRTAKLVLDWKNSTLVAGQDTPFISPLSPDSLVTTAYPAMWTSGNLWAWTPEVFVTHHLQNFFVQYGLLDPLTGEFPPEEYERVPSAGERSRTPAVAMRV
ncbi:MAG TPA: hypothetical protein VF443_02840, partial [Nitrospira sp.]